MYLEQAQESSTEFNEDINKHAKIIAIRKVHKFFEMHKLIENADVMESRFDQ